MCWLINLHNKAEAAVARKCINKKHEKLDTAFASCKETSLMGHSAVISSSSTDSNVVKSLTDLRKCSILYWMIKFEIPQNIIYKGSQWEVSEGWGILRLLPASKLKPKENVQDTRLTQICGSIEGKEVLNVVESLKKQKAEKVIGKEKKKRKEKGI